MKRTFYLPDLPKRKVQPLMDGMLSHFHNWGMHVEFDHTTMELSYDMASMGRTLYSDESSESTPFKLGKPVSVDSLRRNEIRAYVNGFYRAAKK